nr:MAG TPA: hypothetical protein [Caudoviricetes sp.]
MQPWLKKVNYSKGRKRKRKTGQWNQISVHILSHMFPFFNYRTSYFFPRKQDSIVCVH